MLFEDDCDYLNDLKEIDFEGYEFEMVFILLYFNCIVKIKDWLILVGEMGLMVESVDNG